MSFQSFKYLSSLVYDEKTKLYSYEYKIVDSEFKEIIIIGYDTLDSFISAIIQVYSKRNLNVAKNFFLFMLYFQNSYWTLETQINYYKRYIPEFKKYEEEINKYLILK